MNNLEITRRLHELSRTVTCTRTWCQAVPGEFCRTRNGVRASQSHDNRYLAEHVDQVSRELNAETRRKLRGG